MIGHLWLSRKVIRLATAKGVTVGTAESLTGGLIAAALAGVPGASRVLMGGIVSYDPAVKHQLLGVAQDVIDGVGVVSEPCARQMAKGAREALKADVAVSVTGLAGPGGGTEETPVGTVFLGLATLGGVQVRRVRFAGGRQAVRKKTTQEALKMLLRALEEI